MMKILEKKKNWLHKNKNKKKWKKGNKGKENKGEKKDENNCGPSSKN